MTGIGGHLIRETNVVERAALVCARLLLLATGLVADAAGWLFLAVLASQQLMTRRVEPAA